MVCTFIDSFSDDVARWLAQLESHHGLEKWRHKMEDAADDVLYASQRAQECAEEALDLGILRLDQAIHQADFELARARAEAENR